MTCGGGQKFRARLCDSPLPNEGGSLCPSNETFSLSITDDGKLKQSYTETCNDNNCPTTTSKDVTTSTATTTPTTTAKPDVWYVRGTKGSRTCHIGSTITTTQECQIACRGLNKQSLPGRDGNPCYIAVNGKCKQDGRYSRKNYPVCKTLGITKVISYLEGNVGSRTCVLGSPIMTSQECKTACGKLNKRVLFSTLKEGQPCYFGKKGCRQDGRQNRKSRLVCKAEDNQWQCVLPHQLLKGA